MGHKPARKEDGQILLKNLTFFLIIGVVVAGLSLSCQPRDPPAPPAFQVSFVDVGQGDAAIVQVGTHSMLIDAGTNASTARLIKTIKSDRIKNFDLVVGTHPHEDHIGGLDEVLNQFGVSKIYMPRVSAETKTFSDVLQAIQRKGLTVSNPIPGSNFNLGTASCVILAPNAGTYGDLNNYSIVLKLTYGSNSFLFTGDAQSDSEKEILAKGYNLKADVLKVGHHGSSSSTTLEFLQAVSPQFAVISTGLGNDYGHPHQVTLDKLLGSGVKVYRTDLNHDITFSSDGQSLSLKTGK
jgi:competence protein ComEC